MKENELVKKIPSYVRNVANVLNLAGFECYLVGGPVRDLLMNKIPDDFDLTTDARPDQIVSLFPRSISKNAKFGTIIVLAEDENKETVQVEVTTYRSEANYVDGRWPSEVEFTKDLHLDLGRRDFTINAMAVNLQTIGDGIEDNDVIDLFGGIIDLRNGIVRAVGTPYERFQEDGLRAFRACRLASEFNFSIDHETYNAIKDSVDIAGNISVERIRDEFLKILKRSPKPSVGINLLKDLGLLKFIVPELLEGINVKQPEKYHVHDVYDHILATVDAAEDSVKLAALFHDIGKPRCEENGHFYHHDVISAEMAREIMTRLKFSKARIEKVVNLVRWHMFVFANWRGEDEIESNWTDSAIRRLIRNVGGEENIEDLIKLRIADAVGNPKSNFNPQEIQLLESRISEVRAKDMFLTVSDLKISGIHLANLGIEKGPVMGKILSEILEKVIDDPSLNTKEKLINLVEEEYL